MAAILGLGGPSMATKFAIDGPGESLVAGDYLRHDKSGYDKVTVSYPLN